MKRYEFFPHTADVKFKAYGGTMEEAFSNAALALTKIMVEPDNVGAETEEMIEVESEDEKALLYDFLERFLVLFEVNGFLMHSVKELEIEKEDKFRLKAIVEGDDNLSRYEPETHIKAITYQEMEVFEKDGKWLVQVVPDI
ncbi:archease [Candidatus Woesearchaeota archaeon]|nr:archease [Candidatus Woesearchaeota archaeon]